MSSSDVCVCVCVGSLDVVEHRQLGHDTHTHTQMCTMAPKESDHCEICVWMPKRSMSLCFQDGGWSTFCWHASLSGS